MGTSEVGEIKRARLDERHAESGRMIDSDKQVQELRKDVIETRNLIIKNDNLLKNVQGDLKKVLDKQDTLEKRSWSTSATALIIIAALASVGAYKFASVEVRATTEELANAKIARKQAEDTAEKIKAEQESAERASKKALDVFDRLASDDEAQHSLALAELAKLDMKKLTPLEQRGLEDKSRALKLEAARVALESGRTSVARHDWRGANDSLTRYLTLASKVDAQAYLLVGQAREQLHEYKDAIDPLQKFLKEAPSSKQADYATLLLGDALSSSGDVKQALEVYKAGGSRYYGSQAGILLRARARRFQKQLKDEAAASGH